MPTSATNDFASGVSDDRPGLDSCVRALWTGDVLVVWKLDRLGRTLAHLVNNRAGLGGSRVYKGAIRGKQNGNPSLMIRHTSARCLLLILLWPATGSAQIGSIRGSVVDQTDLVLPGATVTLRGNGVPRTAYSDEQGNFELGRGRTRHLYAARVARRVLRRDGRGRDGLRSAARAAAGRAGSSRASATRWS